MTVSTKLLEFVPESKHEVGFRIISAYQTATDSTMTRFDVLLNHKKIENGPIGSGDQFGVGFSSSGPGSLIIPSSGIIDGFSVNGSADDLINAFRSLADAIEKNLKR